METVTLFLAGDVMTGRGIDQVLPNPGSPALFEDYAKSAQDYVALAENAHGPISAPVGFEYIWGDALRELKRWQPHARIINLETAITAEGIPEPKGINYRMHPENIPVLAAAGIDCCVLANNHMLDWGQTGLRNTLAALDCFGINRTGAGLSLAEANRPAVIEVQPNQRICIYGVGSATSGIPRHWAAGERLPGIHLLPDLSALTAEGIAEAILSQKRAGDVTILSIHWGSNWGYDLEPEQRSFAHRLIDCGACDVIHGHSSHHPRAVEIYRGKLILYGCGDFINDYEGIRGKERYRGDLSVMYLPSLETTTGLLKGLSLVIFQLRRFRLQTAAPEDVLWLQGVLNREARSFGVRFVFNGGRLDAVWP